MPTDRITLIEGTFKDCEDIYKQLNSEEQQKTNGFSADFLTCVFQRVAVVQSCPVGFVRLLKGIGVNILSTEVMILPEYRQQNIGTILVQKATEWYQHSNYTNLYWLCDIQNIGSQKLATKTGFWQIETTTEYITYMYTKTE